MFYIPILSTSCFFLSFFLCVHPREGSFDSLAPSPVTVVAASAAVALSHAQEHLQGLGQARRGGWEAPESGRVADGRVGGLVIALDLVDLPQQVSVVHRDVLQQNFVQLGHDRDELLRRAAHVLEEVQKDSGNHVDGEHVLELCALCLVLRQEVTDHRVDQEIRGVLHDARDVAVLNEVPQGARHHQLLDAQLASPRPSLEPLGPHRELGHALALHRVQAGARPLLVLDAAPVHRPSELQLRPPGVEFFAQAACLPAVPPVDEPLLRALAPRRLLATRVAAPGLPVVTNLEEILHRNAAAAAAASLSPRRRPSLAPGGKEEEGGEDHKRGGGTGATRRPPHHHHLHLEP
mmetsp:Transcript_3497/g.9840  ORF Transcript_3497/g.9840 Transcript_3497/m.9840 type:complete len:349 (-) Transcript_3497:385-1431(-)